MATAFARHGSDRSRGFGLEIMANSDNVLRGGLTDKHIAVDELLDVLDFTRAYHIW